MSKDLTVFAPSGGDWKEQPGKVCYVNCEDSSPSVARGAPSLSINDRFEVTDIPAAMTKLGWNKAAALLNKWFHAPKNQAVNAFHKVNGFLQNGTGMYSADRFDESTVPLDWILSFPRTKKGFEKLQRATYLTAGRAESNLIGTFRNHWDRKYVDAITLCNGDIFTLHQRFQFQLVKIDTTALEKANTFFDATLHHGVPDDLAGALGGFSLCAAVAEAYLRPTFFGDTEIEVTKVAIYMKNPYSFFDDPLEGGSQYLGHWCREGILLVPEGYVSQRAAWGSWSHYVVQPEGPYGRTYWPIHNSDFRRWQNAHNAGGDMVLFSDYKVVKLNPPIKLRVSK
jgi:hypothetical protein